MAILHRAQIRPSKLELVRGWLPGRPWYDEADASAVEAVGAFRFDDPAGEVGIETHLVRTGSGRLLQVPLTYRGRPLPGGEDLLVGTMEHSVLGRRWVYDGCGDPVYVTALAATVLGGAAQAEEYFEVEGRREVREPTVVVQGSGRDLEAPVVTSVGSMTSTSDAEETVIAVPGVELAVRRLVDPGAVVPEGPALTGTWAGQEEPVLLVAVRR